MVNSVLFHYHFTTALFLTFFTTNGYLSFSLKLKLKTCKTFTCPHKDMVPKLKYKFPGVITDDLA